MTGLDQTPVEWGEDALALMLGQFPVSMALAQFVMEHQSGSDARTAMQAAIHTAQTHAARRWRARMTTQDHALTMPGIAMQKARQLGEMQGRVILLSMRLRSALALLRSDQPGAAQEGIAMIEAITRDAQEEAIAMTAPDTTPPTHQRSRRPE